jgi:hypothetical protein
MSLFGDILREAIYSKRKMFYHVSYNKFSKFERRNSYRKDDPDAGGVFLTPSPQMIRLYISEYLLERFPRDEYFIYRCFLKRELNIFNPSNREDRKNFLDIIAEDPMGFFEEFTIKSRHMVSGNLNQALYKLLHDSSWVDAENPAVSGLVRNLGYDGYESAENGVMNVLVFNPEDVIVPDEGPFKTFHPKTDTKEWWSKSFPDSQRPLQFPGRGNIKKDELGFKDTDIYSVFEVAIARSEDFEEDFKRYSFKYDFNGRGELILPNFVDSLNHVIGDNDFDELRYDGKAFDSVSALTRYLGNKYKVTYETDSDEED